MAETLARHAARIDAEAAEADSYVDWCEANDLDPDEDHRDSFRVERNEAREVFLESLAEDRADRAWFD